MSPKPCLLSVAICALLASCGGGSGVKSSPPPETLPETPPRTPPETPPETLPDTPDPKCNDPGASNFGSNVSCRYTYTGVEDNLRVPTGIAAAQGTGLDGKGINIGLLDAGYISGYETLGYRVAHYVDRSGAGEVSSDDTHGLAMAAIVAGAKTNYFSGGVAPAANLYWGRVCVNGKCNMKLVTDTYVALTNMGVRLFNLSLGQEGSKTSAKSQTGMIEPTLLKDTLVVAATGNQGTTQPNNPAALPAYDSRVIHNWLAVANVKVDSKGNPVGLDTTSNACGVAAQWCLVAPGYVAIPVMPGYKGKYVTLYYNGTSDSTAIVTGTAALVWQAFPWMKAQQVQETILTTATDLGDVGVDSTYGWGMVNAYKAVGGPSTLLSSWNVAVPAGLTSTFTNDIDGQGGLSLTGEGTLIIDGRTSYTGGTAVNAGHLVINGEVAGQVVQNGGTLGGSGHIDGSLIQNDGVLGLTFDNPLTVAGQTQLSGRVDVQAPQDWHDHHEGVVLSASSVKGTPEVLDNGIFMAKSLVVTDQALVASIHRESGAQRLKDHGLGDQTTAQTAARIDALLEQWDTYQRGESVLAQVQNMSLDTQGALALDSVAGQAHATARTMALSAAQGQQQWITRRALETRNSDDGGAWVMMGHQDNKIRPAQAMDVRVLSDSLVVGADKAVGDWKLGAALHHGELRSNFDRLGGQVKTDQVGASLYATWEPTSHNALSMTISGSRLSNDVRRDLVLGQEGSAFARTRAKLWSAGLVYEQDVLPWLSWRAELNHDHLKSDAFTEQGDHPFRLAAQNSFMDATYLGTALRFDSRLNQSNWTYGMEAGYRRTLNRPSQDFWAEYADLPGSKFVVRGVNPGQNAVWASAQVGYKIGKNKHIQLEGDARNHAFGTDWAAALRYRYEF